MSTELVDSHQWKVERAIQEIEKLCTTTILVHDPKRKARVKSAIRMVFEQHGLRERIDELQREREAHLFQKRYTAPNSGAGRQIAADLKRVELRIAELESKLS